MKSLLLLCVLSSASYADILHEVKKELFFDIKTETKRCAIQLISKFDASEVVGYKSICDTLVIVSQREANIMIDKKWLKATIEDSIESDGGDLDNLIITRNNKIVAKRINVPSCGSIINAMAGEEFEKEIID